MRKLFVIVALCLGGLLAFAAAAELTFGTWFDSDPLDGLGLARDKSTAIHAAALYEGGGDFTYHRDHWGFRGPGTNPARVTILTVGGSTTDQPYLPDEATWQAVMEREFRAQGSEAVVANAGKDDQSTIGHLWALTEWFPKVPGLKPRFILFYVGLADMVADGRDAGPSTSRPEWARQHSFLWRQGARLFGNPRIRFANPPADFAKAEWTDKPAQPDATPAAFQERLRRLAQLSHDMGAVPVFVTQTRADFKTVDGKVLGMVEEGALNGVDHYRLLAQFNKATREVCSDEGLLCLDLARELTFEPGDFYDYLHNTPQGAEKIGRWLASKLAGLV